MKLKLLLPFAICLACTAIGQQPAPSAAEGQEALQKRKLRELNQAELAAGQAPRREARRFVFPGGTPTEFLAAVDKEMGSHLSEVATIPDGANRIRVPQIRAKMGNADDAITLFDSIADTNGGIGRWIMQKTRSATPGADDDVLSLVFVPPPMHTAPTGLDVRAVSLRDIPESKWKAFAELLDETMAQQAEMQKEFTGAPASLFTARIHPETGMLVAMGGKEQMDRVETLTAAMRTSFVARPEAGEEGMKARAFSIAGLSKETVSNLIDEMTSRSDELRAWQAKRAEQSGTPVGGSLLIFGRPEPVDRLHVLIVAGNSAGLEFAESLIEEVKKAMEEGEPGKFVIVDGAVDSRGSVPWTPKLTVLGAIAAAHGRSGNFGDTIQLTRDGTTRTLSYKELKFDPAKNERVQPGDRIEMGYLPKPAAPTEKP